MKENYIEKELNKLFENLSSKKKEHVEAVLQMANQLADIYGEDKEKIKIAVMVHDAFKELTDEELNEYVKKFNLDEYYLNNKNLSHGKVASKYLEKELQIKDKEILDAVSYHTTGRANMSMIEKIVYIADAVEHTRRFPGVSKMRSMALIDIDDACIMCMDNMISYLNARDLFVDKDTLEARNFLVREKSLEK